MTNDELISAMNLYANHSGKWGPGPEYYDPWPKEFDFLEAFFTKIPMTLELWEKLSIKL